MTSSIEIRPLGPDNMADARSLDASFVIDAELVLDAKGGVISYEVRPLPPTRKTLMLPRDQVAV